MIFDNLDTHAIVAGASSVVASIVTAAWMTWRKMQQNKTAQELDDTRNEAEIDLVNHLEDQRDFAMQEARNARDSQKIADLENQATKAKVTALENELFNLRKRVQLLSQLVTRLTTALDLTKSQLNAILQKTTSRSTDSPEKQT